MKDRRISIGPYRREIENVTLQFEIIRFLLKRLTESEKKKFFGKLAKEGIDAAMKFEAIVETHGILDAESAKQIAEMQIQYAKREQRMRNKTKVHQYVEFLEDKLNQSEMLLLVAHFESFMKLVHEAFLRAAPHKVFGSAFRGRQGARVGLREIFSADDQAWSTQKFLTELVTKEVKWLDSQAIQQKATYFDKHFGIPFGTDKDIKALKEIMRRRNQISHEIFEPSKSDDEMLKVRLGEGKEPPLVSNEMLQRARNLFRTIPDMCIKAGAKRYQSYFRSC